LSDSGEDAVRTLTERGAVINQIRLETR